jgi:hypothetical protein
MGLAYGQDFSTQLLKVQGFVLLMFRRFGKLSAGWLTDHAGA